MDVVSGDCPSMLVQIDPEVVSCVTDKREKKTNELP